MAVQNQQIVKKKELSKVRDQSWKKLKEDQFGEDEFLLKLLQREKAKRGEK